MASCWISRPSSDTSWLGGNNRGGKSIGTNGRAKGSTILVSRPASLAYNMSSRQPSHTASIQQQSLFSRKTSPLANMSGKESLDENEEHQYSAAQSPDYQDLAFEDNAAMNVNTVPGTFPEKTSQSFIIDERVVNEPQMSSLGGMPRCHYPSFDHHAPNVNPPSQVVFHSKRSFDDPINEEGSNPNSTSDSGGSATSATRRDSESNRSADGSRRLVDESIEEGQGMSSGGNASVRPSNNSSDDENVEGLRYASARPSNNSNVLGNVTNLPTMSLHDIPEWDGCNPNFILKRLKAIPKIELQSRGKREFYKSYYSWEKMSLDQRNKTLLYFRSLPEDWQGT
jgi:hypothetical protein